MQEQCNSKIKEQTVFSRTEESLVLKDRVESRFFGGRQSVSGPLGRLVFPAPRRVGSIRRDRAVHTILCSFSGRPAFGHSRFPFHGRGLEGRMFPPPPKLEVNELPHHEGLSDANGRQDRDPNRQHIEVPSTEVQLLVLCSCQAKANSED